MNSEKIIEYFQPRTHLSLSGEYWFLSFWPEYDGRARTFCVLARTYQGMVYTALKKMQDWGKCHVEHCLKAKAVSIPEEEVKKYAEEFFQDNLVTYTIFVEDYALMYFDTFKVIPNGFILDDEGRIISSNKEIMKKYFWAERSDSLSKEANTKSVNNKYLPLRDPEKELIEFAETVSRGKDLQFLHSPGAKFLLQVEEDHPIPKEIENYFQELEQKEIEKKRILKERNKANDKKFEEELISFFGRPEDQ